MTDIQINSEEIGREFNTQQLAEICYHVCRKILRHIISCRVRKECRNNIYRTIKTIKDYLNKLSEHGIEYFQEKPSKDILFTSLICYKYMYEGNKESLGLSLIEFNLDHLNKIHPRRSLDFLDLFMRESMKSLKAKWKYVPAHTRLPSMCLAKLRKLIETLHDELIETSFNELNYSGDIAYAVIRLEDKNEIVEL